MERIATEYSIAGPACDPVGAGVPHAMGADALSELVKLATARIVQEVLEREQHRPDWRIMSGRSRRS